MFTDYQQRINDAVMAAEIGSPPDPWTLVRDHWHDGSTLAIGYSSCEEFLIATDIDSRWLISTQSGEIQFDETEAPVESWWDFETLTMAGFGALDGQRIRTSGQLGSAAGFHNSTDDGWCIHEFRSSYCDIHICLDSPDGQLYSREPQFTKIASPATSLITFGFTPSGTKMVVIERDTFTIWSRPTIAG